MFDLTNTLEIPPFSLNKKEKLELYSEAVQSLTRFHFENCQPYQKILNKIGFVPDKSHRLEEYPFIPVRLFKENELVSVDRSKIVKTMTSSGTTGQSVSRIWTVLQHQTDKSPCKNRIQLYWHSVFPC